MVRAEAHVGQNRGALEEDLSRLDAGPPTLGAELRESSRRGGPGSSPLEPDPLVLALYAELGRRREFDGHAHVAGAGVALALQTVLLAFAIPGDGIWSLHFAAALAALGIAIASLQTMGKHRYHQSVDARQMALLGTRMGARALGIVVHGEPGERLAFARAMGISTGQFAQISSPGCGSGRFESQWCCGPPRDRREADLPGTCCGRWRSILGCGRRHRRGDRAVTGDTGADDPRRAPQLVEHAASLRTRFVTVSGRGHGRWTTTRCG